MTDISRKLKNVKHSVKHATARRPAPDLDETVSFAVLNVSPPFGVAVFGLIEDVVDELPSLRPLRVLLQSGPLRLYT